MKKSNWQKSKGNTSKIISIIICLSIMVVFFASCGLLEKISTEGEDTTLQAENEKITLTLWHIWSTESDSNKAPFERALNQWTANNPNIEINVEAVESETYKTKIRTAIAANEAPDIFFSWGAGFAKPFVEAGKVLALDDYLDNTITDKFIPGTLANFTYDKKIYGLPTFITAGVLYCNQELFDFYDVKIPETYDQLKTAVEVFNNNEIIPMAVGQKDEWPGSFHHNILAIRTAGIKLNNNVLNKIASYKHPDIIESAKVLNELIELGAFDPNCLQRTAHEAEQIFIDGKSAMYYIGSWAAGTLDRENSPMKDKVVVRNFPEIEGASGDANGFLGGAIDTFMISANSEHKDEAVLALFGIIESFSRESYLSGAGIPAWKMSEEEQSASPLMQEILKLLENGDGFVLAWDTVLNGEEAEIYKDLIAEIFAGITTPEEFAEEMQKLNE